MSAYHSYETQITDEGCLVAALEDEGFKPEVVEGEGKNLTGYMGDKRAQKAQVIIPRKQVGGSSNDIGFAKNKDGKFEAIISSYDSSKYNKAWLDKVKKAYATKMAMKCARAAGLRFAGQKTIDTPAGKKLQLVFNK